MSNTTNERANSKNKQTGWNNKQLKFWVFALLWFFFFSQRYRTNILVYCNISAAIETHKKQKRNIDKVIILKIIKQTNKQTKKNKTFIAYVEQWIISPYGHVGFGFSFVYIYFFAFIPKMIHVTM